MLQISGKTEFLKKAKKNYSFVCVNIHPRGIELESWMEVAVYNLEPRR